MVVTECLESFLKHHLTWFGSTGTAALWLQQEAYNTSRIVHSDGDRVLFSFWSPDVDCTLIRWYPAVTAIVTRVTLSERHRPFCNGKPLPSEYVPRTILGAVLVRCGCPVDITARRRVWLVTPKKIAVDALLTLCGNRVEGDEAFKAVRFPLRHGTAADDVEL